MRLDAELANLDNESCLIHTPQLSLNGGIDSQKSVIYIISICRNIVCHFNHSRLGYSRLKNIQDALYIPQHKLLQDVRTRWNSTLYMLQRLVE